MYILFTLMSNAKTTNYCISLHIFSVGLFVFSDTPHEFQTDSTSAATPDQH